MLVVSALWQLIDQEREAGVRAVLGHHLFAFIHPYFDGNGQVGRFLMNTRLGQWRVSMDGGQGFPSRHLHGIP